MSRAFVKEDAGDDELPDRPQSSAPNYVTPEGLAALRRRVLGLKERLSPLERDAAEARELRRELRYCEGRLARAILVDAAGRAGGSGRARGADAEARFGACVEARDPEGRSWRFRIVGQDEAEEGGEKIAWDSPLALALMGAKAGDRVEWARPEGVLALELTAVRYPGS